MDSDQIVFTEPVTRPNRADDLWEADAVYLYRARPIQLYPGESSANVDPSDASPRISRARLATIVDDAERLSNDPGSEVIVRSPSEGLVVLRRINLGWLVACARPDASLTKVNSELARFCSTVAERFESSEQPVAVFDEESTELMKAGRRSRAVTWQSIIEDLNERIDGAPGKFKMFAVKEWRRCATSLPIGLDLRKGFAAHNDEPLGRTDELEVASAYEAWLEKLEQALGELPEAFSEEPPWMLSKRKKERTNE